MNNKFITEFTYPNKVVEGSYPYYQPIWDSPSQLLDDYTIPDGAIRTTPIDYINYKVDDKSITAEKIETSIDTLYLIKQLALKADNTLTSLIVSLFNLIKPEKDKVLFLASLITSEIDIFTEWYVICLDSCIASEDIGISTVASSIYEVFKTKFKEVEEEILEDGRK